MRGRLTWEHAVRAVSLGGLIYAIVVQNPTLVTALIAALFLPNVVNKDHEK